MILLKIKEEVGFILMERIIQIISHVMKEFLTHEGHACSRQSLTKELVRLGYDPDDINAAFDSLFAVPVFLNDKVCFPEKFSEIKQGQRIFSPAEQKKLSMAFQREIVRLTNCCLLSLSEAEQVLFEAMQLEITEVGLKELELILQKTIKEEERIMLMLPYKADMSVAFLLN
ncbi:MAG TPA: DUF494 family protein [Bacillota bacterium]|nr:DUF494 family protein [Bacillota bacterium]